MMKKKKLSRSQSSTKKTQEPSPGSSPSPRLLSIFRSKLVSKDLKHMFRGMRTKTAPGLSSQSRIVRCPKCHKLLQEPIDATIYKCSGCDSILQAKRWELESNGNSIPEALLFSQNRSLSTKLESGSKTPMRSTHSEYNSRASPSVERGYHSETIYKHERSDVRREWMRKADEFSGGSDAFASARSSPYNSRSSASEWTRYEDPPPVPFYPASPSPSSAYEYGYNSPFHGSQASASEQSYGRSGWFQESCSAASPIRFPGETSNGKYYHSYSRSQHDPRYHNLYEPSSSASVYSERSYQSATEPLRSTYSDHSKSEKSSQREKKKHVKKKKPVFKRYVFPSAGGAPFVACSYCLELLQLPQVSLHGKHKRYQVRCGSCSGVLKFSVGEKADSHHQDSHSRAEDTTASESREEIYPDNKGSGDRICKSNDDVILRRNMEALEDKGSKENIRSISSKFLDSELEPSLNHKLREQQPASSESITNTSRNHLEQSEEACSEKSTEMDNSISERVSCDLEQAGYEKNEILKAEGSGESLEVPVYKNERMSGSSIEAETVADRPVSHSGEPNEYVCETVLSENTGDPQEFDWKETQEHEEYGGECKREDIMGDKPGLILEKSRYIGDPICDSSSSNIEIYEDTTLKENTKHISVAAHNENQRFIGHPDQSCEATVTTSRIHEEQSKHEYENLSERQELDNTISDRVRYELEESTYETNEALDTDKVSEDGSVVSLTKASETLKTSVEAETGEERSVSHQMDSLNEKVEDIYERLEYAGERTWTETMEDRAGLHLEEYESNYENYNKPFEWSSEGAPTCHVHEYEIGTILEPEDAADGRLESSSRGSFSDHESSKENALFTEAQDADQSQYEYEIPSERPELSNTIVEPEEDASGILDSSSSGSYSDHESSEEVDVFQESQDAKSDQSKYEYEIPSERKELCNTAFNTERHEIQEYRYETNETFEQAKMIGDGSIVSIEKANETNIGKTGDEMAPQNESLETSNETVEQDYLEESGYASETTCAEAMGDGAVLQLEEYHNNPHEWTSERAPTFRLHESELGTVPASEEDMNVRSSSSIYFTNDHESSEEKAMAHEQPSLVDENKTEELAVTLMVEDGPSSQLEQSGNDSTKLEETFEWSSERAPTFRLHESELGTMLEPDVDADGRSESSSTGSFNNHESSELRAVFHEEEKQLMTKDRVSLDLEKGENESIKLDWTSERAPTFRLHESELGIRLEPDEDADGRSESSSRGSFNDHVISKETEMDHVEEPMLVTDTVSLHLECENESMKLDETFEWTSGRSLTFRRHEYEPHNGPSLNSEKCENEKVVLDQTLEPRDDDVFMLSIDDTLEQEMKPFHSEVSKEKQVNLSQTFKQGDTEENIPASEDHESPSKMAEVDILGDHLDHLQIENEKFSGLTYEPYYHFYNTTDPSEIVGLRLALYETPNSPLRSPLSSPIHTPIGSPLHILMRSPIASPMHPHIVSPMRSPINSSGSLSDVLFFGKTA